MSVQSKLLLMQLVCSIMSVAVVFIGYQTGRSGPSARAHHLGVTALTRQPNPGSAYALEEVTALEIDREHLEQIVMSKPMLLQDLGRLIDERHDKVMQATRREPIGESMPHTRG